MCVVLPDRSTVAVGDECKEHYYTERIDTHTCGTNVMMQLYCSVCVWGGGGAPTVLGRNLLMQFSRLSSSKMENSEPNFVDTLTIQNDQISHVKRVLPPLYVFFGLFGCWGGGVVRGLGYHLLMQFSRLSSSKTEISKPVFSDTLTMHNDQISY